MNILVLGKSGMIGNAIFQNFSAGCTVRGTYRSHIPETSGSRDFHFDVSDKNELALLLEEAKPDVVVSSLRGSFPDQENRHKELAEYLLKTGGRLVFLSTANVFDGCPFELHSESNMPCPASDYGQFKYRCERILQTSLGDQLAVVRLPKVLSKARVRRLLTQKTSDQPFPLYSNLFMSANTDENVAGGVRYIIDHGLSGIFHLTSRDYISFESFYREIFKRAGREEIGFQRAEMSTEAYCKELGNVSADLLRGKDSGKYFLELSSKRNDLPSRFYPNCEEVIEALFS